MRIDFTLAVTPTMTKTAQNHLKIASYGHLGTHFDVMDKVFPLTYTRREGYIFDCRHLTDITPADLDVREIKAGMFIAFYTGHIEDYVYGSKDYFTNHPQLSRELIDFLINRQVAIIGIDAPGIRRGKEHTVVDQLCADHGVFVVENMAHLHAGCHKPLIINTYPMNFVGLTGLPCRVIGEMADD